MTTICGDKHRLVADGMISDTDSKWVCNKIERIGRSLYATAGSASEGERFYSWIRSGAPQSEKPVVSESFSALELTTKGLFFYDSELFPNPLPNAHAIGSGAKAARAAMMCGVDMVRAVEIACELDASSGPPIQIVYLKQPKKEKP